MELDVFLEEYGRLLKEDSEKAQSLSAVASVYVKLASELLQSGNQKYEEKRRIQSMFQANKVTNEWFNFSKEELLLVRQQFT